MTGTVLILGATGRFGRNAAEAFWNAGWRVRLFDRKTDDLTAAADGADVIVNGWNLPYPDWAAGLPRLTRQVIAAAEASGATILLPGNVYVFGTDAPERLAADTPHAATNGLGRVRIEMEQAYRNCSAQVICLRAGDFLDDAASGNWFDRMMAPSLKQGVLRYPGRTDAVHAWAFLPDFARAAVMLAERRTALPRHADIPFPGYAMTGAEMAACCAAALQRPVRVRRMSWLPIYLALPFWKTARHLLEMRYLWSKPHRLDGTVFDAWLPEFRATAPQDALGRAIAPVLNPVPAPDRPRPDGAARQAQPRDA